MHEVVIGNATFYLPAELVRCELRVVSGKFPNDMDVDKAALKEFIRKAWAGEIATKAKKKR